MIDTIRERFWAKVRKGDDCWEWQGAKCAKGYGRFFANGRNRRSNRMVWELEVGEIPGGLWVLHHCDNPACVRLDHLYLGTAADNSRDASVRDRISPPLRRYYADPVHRKAHQQRQKKIWGRPELRRRMSEAHKGQIPWNKGLSGYRCSRKQGGVL